MNVGTNQPNQTKPSMTEEQIKDEEEKKIAADK